MLTADEHIWTTKEDVSRINSIMVNFFVVYMM